MKTCHTRNRIYIHIQNIHCLHYIHNICIYLSAYTLRKQKFLMHFENNWNVSRYSRTVCVFLFFDFSRNLVGERRHWTYIEEYLNSNFGQKTECSGWSFYGCPQTFHENSGELLGLCFQPNTSYSTIQQLSHSILQCIIWNSNNLVK